MSKIKGGRILPIIVFHVLTHAHGGSGVIIMHVRQPGVPPERYWDPPQGNFEMYSDHFKLPVNKDTNGYIQLPITILKLRKGEEARRINRPMVEVGPGFFKTAILSYPADYDIEKFKKLLLLKKKMEERNKE